MPVLSSAAAALCAHCGDNLPPEAPHAHVERCRWTCRPTKASGYRYLVAVVTPQSAAPLVVRHTDTRVDAQRAATDVTHGRLPLLNAVEVRVIRRDRRVTDRWVLRRDGRRWHRIDMLQLLRGATLDDQTAPAPFAPVEATLF